MSETKYTPGPWEVYKPQPDDRPGIEAPSSGLSVIVFGDPAVTDDAAGVHGASDEQGLANANLIAAAPELYEALHYGLHWLEGSARAAAVAALAKARGETV